MKTQQTLSGIHILSILGQQGTGKSTLSQHLSERLSAQHIEVSDVVHSIHGELTRSEMPKTNKQTKDDPGWLGNAIVERIRNKKVILSGVREIEVHDLLRMNHVNLTIIGLWCPQQERYGRVLAAGKVHNYLDFIKHEQAELDMGLAKLLKIAPQYPSSFITVDHLATLIIRRCPKGLTS